MFRERVKKILEHYIGRHSSLARLILLYAFEDVQKKWYKFLSAEPCLGRGGKCYECDEYHKVTFFNYYKMRRDTACPSCDKFIYCCFSVTEYQICIVEETCLFCETSRCQHTRPSMASMVAIKGRNDYTICQECRESVQSLTLERRHKKANTAQLLGSY
jgi:hypothetical protein